MLLTRSTFEADPMRGPWYAAYLSGRDTVMHIAEDRETAISNACEMLSRGIVVTEVGPMVETSELVLGRAAIRRIWQRRNHAEQKLDQLTASVRTRNQAG